MRKLLTLFLVFLLLFLMVSCQNEYADFTDSETEGGTSSQSEVQTPEYRQAIFVAEGIISYVTYNERNNPVHERIFDLDEGVMLDLSSFGYISYSGESYTLREYTYNDAGLLIEIVDNSMRDFNGSVNQSMRIEFMVEDGIYKAVRFNEEKIDYLEYTNIEYYENGTLKKIAISDDDYYVLGFEQDELGRRTAHYVEYGKTVLTYRENSYEMLSGTIFGKSCDAVATLEFDYSQGEISEITKKLLSNEVKSVCSVEHTNGNEALKCRTFYSYLEGELEDKDVTEFTYTDNGWFDRVTYMHYDGEVYEYGDTLEYVYAPDSNHIIRENYTKYNAEGQKDISSTVDREYNDVGRLTKETSCIYEADGSLRYKEIKTKAYDANQNVTKETSHIYGADGTLQFLRVEIVEYNENGNVVKDSFLAESLTGRASYETVYEYNEDGRPVRDVRSVFGDDGELTTVIENIFEYDTEGVRTKHFMNTTEYDANGRKTKCTQIEYGPKGGMPVKQIEIEYDVEGNIVSQKETP